MGLGLSFGNLWDDDHRGWLKSMIYMVLLYIIYRVLYRLLHYLQGFIHPRWLFGISSINSRGWSSIVGVYIPKVWIS